MVDKVKSWVNKNRIESLIIATILLVAAFLRLYKIDEYLTFLGDEGRDVMIVRRLLVNFDPILIGPGTSIGNMYLGPHYYYLMAPFLFIANFSPVGPAVMVALLSLVTVFLIYYIGREWFGRTAGIIASLLYAIAPTIIIYSRSSWNPNIMPFFALLSIYSMWRVYIKKEFLFLVLSAFCLAMALNSHYLGLLLVPVLGFYWFLTFLQVKVKKLELKKFIKKTLLSVFLFIILMSPLVIFDARHGYINFNAMKTFFTVRQETVSIKPWSSLSKILPLSEKIAARLVTATMPSSGKYIFYGLLMFGAYFAYTNRKSIFKKDILNSPYLLVVLWLGISILGLSQYKQEIYDHYYGFFFPAPFILIGALSQELKNKFKWLGGFFVLLVISYLLVLNLKNSPLKNSPNRQLQRSMAVSKEMEIESGGREFNLAVIAERNYEGAYQYFLEKDDAPLLMIDPQKHDETVADQLFVVCELPVDKCDPTHNPKAGIAGFGWSKIESQKEVEGVILYKLVHAE